MDFKEALLKEHSKAQAMNIAAYIGTSQKRFDQLMELFYDEEWRIHQRAAYAMMMVVDKHPNLLRPHLEKVVFNLKNPVHVAVKRNTIRALEKIDIPEKLLGTVVDICFAFLADPKETIAVKAFSMGVLFKVGKEEPDLFYELRELIEDQMPTASSGFRARGKKILKYIYATIE